MGCAYGEFGPIELDPSARQTLEYVLGTGGSQFPVSLIVATDSQNTVVKKQGKHGARRVDSLIVEEDVESVEATLFISATIIKLCFLDSFGGTANDDAISFKYTIDYPRIELHPFDTKRFKIVYSDEGGDYCLNQCLELKALTRQSRDLIALAIKCFSAHTYYVNSRIISEVNVASGGGASGSLFGEAGVTVSELLLEMDFVKRELYSVINLNKSLENDKHKLKGHL